MTETAQRMQTANIRAGDRVRLGGWPPVWLEVVKADDPSLIEIELPNGATLKAGRLAVTDHRPAAPETTP